MGEKEDSQSQEDEATKEADPKQEVKVNKEPGLQKADMCEKEESQRQEDDARKEADPKKGAQDNKELGHQKACEKEAGRSKAEEAKKKVDPRKEVKDNKEPGHQKADEAKMAASGSKADDKKEADPKKEVKDNKELGLQKAGEKEADRSKAEEAKAAKPQLLDEGNESQLPPTESFLDDEAASHLDKEDEVQKSNGVFADPCCALHALKCSLMFLLQQPYMHACKDRKPLCELPGTFEEQAEKFLATLQQQATAATAANGIEADATSILQASLRVCESPCHRLWVVHEACD